jgi:hypothetical protein
VFDDVIVDVRECVFVVVLFVVGRAVIQRGHVTSLIRVEGVVCVRDGCGGEGERSGGYVRGSGIGVRWSEELDDVVIGGRECVRVIVVVVLVLVSVGP